MAWWVIGLWLAGTLHALLFFALGSILGRRGAFEEGYAAGYEAGVRAAEAGGNAPPPPRNPTAA